MKVYFSFRRNMNLNSTSHHLSGSQPELRKGARRFMRPVANIFLFIIVLIFSACGNDYAPKPRGYFRIKFPEKVYQKYKSVSYSFDYPVYARVLQDSSRDAKPGWLNVSFPQYNGSIHLTFHQITSKEVFHQLIEATRELAFKHTVKATAIDEGLIFYPDKKVYGTYYSIDGNTASAAQFFLTDSTKNYLRGALYFDEQPRLDSIKPVLDFVKIDIDRMIKSFEWTPATR